MDLRPQFARAMEHVAALNFSQLPYEHAPFFETTIRYLGGLLSTYALVVDDGLTSGLPWQPIHVQYNASIKRNPELPDTRTKQHRNRIAGILLSRAEHLARALIPAFNTTSGLPVYGVNTVRSIRFFSFTTCY
jgi:mannosyl-oligosaccharide alpha-1,2-mannosidase